MGTEFEDDLKTMGMIFTPPPGYEVVAPKENRDVRYVYALRNAEKDIALRYLLRPIGDQVREYEEWRQQEDETTKILTNPNSSFMPFFQSILMNVTGEGTLVMADSLFDDEEFRVNADKIMMAVVLPISEFGGNFDRCTIIALHKTNVGMAFTFQLSPATEPTTEDFRDMMQGLRFSARSSASSIGASQP